MQDRYVGDIGDYVKYALLRNLSAGRQLGVAWYLYPDEWHNADGKHVAYLKDHDKWRMMDPELFDCLRDLVDTKSRNVAAIEKSGLLKNALFHSERLCPQGMTIQERTPWRKAWFKRAQSELTTCDVVFADPDNGLCEDHTYRYASAAQHWKRIPLSEAKALASGRTAVIYHHNTRFKGGHNAEVLYWLEQFEMPAVALRWRAYNARTFFVLNPTQEMYASLNNFCEIWGDKAELVS